MIDSLNAQLNPFHRLGPPQHVFQPALFRLRNVSEGLAGVVANAGHETFEIVRLPDPLIVTARDVHPGIACEIGHDDVGGFRRRIRGQGVAVPDQSDYVVFQKTEPVLGIVCDGLALTVGLAGSSAIPIADVLEGRVIEADGVIALASINGSVAAILGRLAAVSWLCTAVCCGDAP